MLATVQSYPCPVPLCIATWSRNALRIQNNRCPAVHDTQTSRNPFPLAQKQVTQSSRSDAQSCIKDQTTLSIQQPPLFTLFPLPTRVRDASVFNPMAGPNASPEAGNVSLSSRSSPSAAFDRIFSYSSGQHGDAVALYEDLLFLVEECVAHLPPGPKRISLLAFERAQKERDALNSKKGFLKFIAKQQFKQTARKSFKIVRDQSIKHREMILQQHFSAEPEPWIGTATSNPFTDSHAVAAMSLEDLRAQTIDMTVYQSEDHAESIASFSVTSSDNSSIRSVNETDTIITAIHIRGGVIGDLRNRTTFVAEDDLWSGLAADPTGPNTENREDASDPAVPGASQPPV
ncbi:hypothetical protein FA95DRAFT_1683259 [Auriscalpium vulgare]|uniref:Uncharacterized protein n=1 Tax=Auriscalpium vulgare TaxID=40419 RepID=A0ACB8RBE3_9AGAM|nr:hypothetical protein FA95DRAFT_1683259 [Auriscalpium vulgare]